MKKVLKCMGMMALVALAFTSCKKNDETKSSFIASGAEFRVENVNEDRAYIDGQTKFHFEQGDVCMVFNIDETTPTNSHAALYGAVEEGVNNVHFYNIGYGEVAEDILDGYYAFYPGGPGHTVTYLANGENKCKFYVAPEQDYRVNMAPKNAVYAAAKASRGTHMMGDTYFKFEGIVGILRLYPYRADGGTVKSIQVVDNGFSLSGLVELIIPEVDPVEMQALFRSYNMDNPAYVTRLNNYIARVGYNVTDETLDDPVTGTSTHYVKGNTLTLNCVTPETPNGLQLGTSRADAPAVNIALRPLACCKGFHLIFTFDDDSTMDIDLSSMRNPIKPGVVSNFPLDMDAY